MPVDTEVWVALITLLSTNLAAFWAYLREKRMSRRPPLRAQFRRDTPFVSRVLPTIREWSYIKSEAAVLIDCTPVDRFILFEGRNGKYEMQHTTAWLQMRAKGLQTYEFKHYEVDEAYRDMVKLARRSPRGVYIVTSDMEDCGLKRIYEVEGVLSSVVHHVADVPLGNDSYAVIYFSMASTTGGMEQTLLTQIELLASRMRVLFRDTSPAAALAYNEQVSQTYEDMK